jgi:ribose 5-phosphate isomerase
MEKNINTIAGVVENGIFSLRRADVVIVAGSGGLQVIDKR